MQEKVVAVSEIVSTMNFESGAATKRERLTSRRVEELKVETAKDGEDGVK